MQKYQYTPAHRAAAIQQQVAARPAPVQAAVKPSQRLRARKAASAILALCMAVALLAVLLVPLLTAGETSAATLNTRAAGSIASLDSVSYGSVEDASSALGFTPKLPLLLQQQAELMRIVVLGGVILEITYMLGKEQVAYRTAAGSEDITDASRTPAFTTTETVDGITRGYSGATENILSLASWAADGYSYAIIASGGLQASDMRNIAESVA